MRNFNLVILEGRLVNDPEVRQLQNGISLCRFSVANNFSYYRDNELQEEVNFIEVNTFSKLAELCGEHLRKGSRVIVNGRIRQGKWQDNEGKQHSKISVTANQVQFLDFKKNVEENQEELVEEEEVPY